MSGRRTPPDPGPIRPFSFPEVVAPEADGVDLRVARLTRFPVATLRAVLPAGEGEVETGRGGVAVLAGDALEEGTEDRDGDALARALEEIGASLSVGTDWDGTTVSVTCLADRLAEAAALLGEVLGRPAFPSEGVGRLRGQRLASLRQRMMTPSSLAGDCAKRLLYAEGVPYGRPVGGTVASVEGLDREAVEAFAGIHHRVRGGGVVAAGDLDPDEVRALVLEHLVGEPGLQPPRGDFRPGIRSPERRIVVVDRPGSVQSEVRVVQGGVPRSTPDYFPLRVVNTVLGGSFTSRLNLNLRERHGFTYGVRSSFSFRRNAGPFVVGTAVGTEVTGDAVREILSEIRRMAEEGPTVAEVESARDYLAGVYPLQLETVEQVASRLADAIVYGLPEDYHRSYRDRIRAVTPEQAADAAGRHLRPGELLVVVVGDASAVEAPLRALDGGPLEVVDPEAASPVVAGR